MGASAAGARATAMFYDLKADAATDMTGAIESVVGFGNATANTFEGALLAVREIWSRLPDVIGDLVFSAANRMLDGIEAMLNGAIARIETTFGQIGDINLGDITNPFAGASADAARAFRCGALCELQDLGRQIRCRVQQKGYPCAWVRCARHARRRASRLPRQEPLRPAGHSAALRKWRLKCRAVADSLKEAGDRLFTFTRLDPSQVDSGV